MHPSSLIYFLVIVLSIQHQFAHHLICLCTPHLSVGLSSDHISNYLSILVCISLCLIYLPFLFCLHTGLHPLCLARDYKTFCSFQHKPESAVSYCLSLCLSASREMGGNHQLAMKCSQQSWFPPCFLFSTATISAMQN